LKKSDFHYDLPTGLIAQQPLAERTASRLLCLDGANGAIRDCRFTDLPQQLRPGDLLVFNDTRVIPARVFGEKDTGGRIELLVERVLDDRRLLAQCRASKPPKPGQSLHLDGGAAARVLGRAGEFYEIEFAGGEPLVAVLERIGHMPLPPYIRRADTAADRERYQTVWARAPGAAAAPTAGLHFDAALLARLDAMGIERATVTLHVGAGTFQPLRVDDPARHRMHRERIELSAAAAAQINRARAAGRRVIAVGTTVVRVLESAAVDGEVRPYAGETDIFIYPGYHFRVVDALITNFHLPESTLLMLVCAFAGTGAVLNAYRHAVREHYRFFSYGDAMFVLPQGKEQSKNGKG
jgi:S-adenosylmethionine:tRNA ribosyltransferase-isomerase